MTDTLTGKPTIANFLSERRGMGARAPKRKLDGRCALAHTHTTTPLSP